MDNYRLLALVILGALWLAACGPLPAPVVPPAAPASVEAAASSTPAPSARPERVLEADAYTRYELLAPGSGRFRILYEVTAVDPGASSYFNPIRKGSVVSDEAVFDRATGGALEFAVVSGAEAEAGGLPGADPATSYLRVRLPRAVPAEGGVRLLIDKTYTDAKSYFAEGEDAERIVFSRPLGVRRNAIVLPSGYEVTGCNIPAQILTEPDGRLAVSFVHTGPEAAPLVIKARRVAPASPAARRAPSAPPPPVAPAVPAAAARGEAERLAERAHQDREIVYFLQPPETHAFSLYHDYTESRPGVDRYLNVVRTGSTVSNPSARNLDTGEALAVEIVRGDALPRSGSGGIDDVAPDAQVVIVRFPPVAEKASMRLRIAETYTDPGSYRWEGDELTFDRTFGRPRNSVVLPAGWYLTATAIPAVVSETADGRIRLDFVNPRPDEIAVLIKARRRPASATSVAPTSEGNR
jgi:hypothetical protein